MTTSPTRDYLEAGRRALSEGAWTEARSYFEAALTEAETPEAFEGLSWAAWWLNDPETLFEARNRAYRMYRVRGDRLGAARMAAWLASDHTDFRGETAIANGWLQRAHRLLDGVEPAPEHGWLAILEGDNALSVSDDVARAKRLAREAAEIGRLVGVTDIEVLGLAMEGIALVNEGQVADGMMRLDEAATAALAGELEERFSAVWALCYVVQACERVRDYDRAAQWCNRIKDLASRFQIQFITGVCRAHYGGVLIWRGAWDEAEEELALAAEDLAATRPPYAGEGLARLGDLRRRQGRTKEAIELFSRAEWHPVAMLGLGEIALEQGNAEEAGDYVHGLLRHLPSENKTGRTAALELLVRVQAVTGDHDSAAETLESLKAIAGDVGTVPLLAASAFAGGMAAAARGDHEDARRHFEDSIHLFEGNGAPYEVGRSRIELAASLAALGRFSAAERQARKALDTLLSLGAAAEAARAEGLLARLKTPASATGNGQEGITRLTPRELEVLRLVAKGLTDRDIAVAL